jgi:hypothetical protein
LTDFEHPDPLVWPPNLIGEQRHRIFGQTNVLNLDRTWRGHDYRGRCLSGEVADAKAPSGWSKAALCGLSNPAMSCKAASPEQSFEMATAERSSAAGLRQERTLSAGSGHSTDIGTA